MDDPATLPAPESVAHSMSCWHVITCASLCRETVNRGAETRLRAGTVAVPLLIELRSTRLHECRHVPTAATATTAATRASVSAVWYLVDNGRGCDEPVSVNASLTGFATCAGGYTADLGAPELLPTVPNCDDATCAFGERDQCPPSAACKPVGGTCVAAPANRAPGEVCGGPGVGRCLAERFTATAAPCECSPGYLGDDCSRCAPGFVAAAAPASWDWGASGQICLELPPPTFRGAPYVATGVPDAEMVADVETAGLGRWAIAGIVVAVLAAVGGVIIGFLMRAARKRDAERSADAAAVMVNSPVFGADLTVTAPLRRLSERAPRHSAPAALTLGHSGPSFDGIAEGPEMPPASAGMPTAGADDGHCHRGGEAASGGGAEVILECESYCVTAAPSELDTVALTAKVAAAERCSAGSADAASGSTAVGVETVLLTVPMAGGEVYGGETHPSMPSAAYFNPLAVASDSGEPYKVPIAAASGGSGDGARPGLQRTFSNPLVEMAVSDMSSVADQAWRCMGAHACEAAQPPAATRSTASWGHASAMGPSPSSRGPTLDGSAVSEPWSLSDASDAAGRAAAAYMHSPPSNRDNSRHDGSRSSCGNLPSEDSPARLRERAVAEVAGVPGFGSVVAPLPRASSGSTVAESGAGDGPSAAPLRNVPMPELPPGAPVVTLEFLTSRRGVSDQQWLSTPASTPESIPCSSKSWSADEASTGGGSGDTGSAFGASPSPAARALHSSIKLANVFVGIRPNKVYPTLLDTETVCPTGSGAT